MIRLIIYKIDGNDYFLKDDNNKTYHLKLKFYRFMELPKINDSLFIHESLLHDENLLLRLGPINGKYGRKIKSSSDADLIVLVNDKEEIYLKRYYG